MGKGGLIEADLEMTEGERAQLDPLAAGVWRRQRNPLEPFRHANTWNVAVDVHLWLHFQLSSTCPSKTRRPIPSHPGCTQAEEPLQGWGRGFFYHRGP